MTREIEENENDLKSWEYFAKIPKKFLQRKI